MKSPGQPSETTETTVTGGGTTVHTTLGGLYEKIAGPSGTEHRYMIHANGRLVAQISKIGTTTTTQYAHTDLLGSVDVLTTISGSTYSVVESKSFGEYGEPRPAAWSGAGTPSFDQTTAGYTGHEMDPEFGLINMNARLYDPVIARFITPDSVIPDVYNPQSLNRYSYALNNPFRYTDPSGHFANPLPDGGIYEDQWNLIIPGNGGAPFNPSTGQQFGSVGDALNFQFPGYTAETANCVGAECGFQANAAAYNFSLSLAADHRVPLADGASFRFCDAAPGACDPMADLPNVLAPVILPKMAAQVGVFLADDLPRMMDDAWNGAKGWLGRGADDVAAGARTAGNPAVVSAATRQFTNVTDLVPTHRMTESRAEFELLKKSISTDGIKNPILFVEANGQKLVVDGHHRLLAARELGFAKVPTERVELPFGGYQSVNDLFDRGW